MKIGVLKKGGDGGEADAPVEIESKITFDLNNPTSII